MLKTHYLHVNPGTTFGYQTGLYYDTVLESIEPSDYPDIGDYVPGYQRSGRSDETGR